MGKMDSLLLVSDDRLLSRSVCEINLATLYGHDCLSLLQVIFISFESEDRVIDLEYTVERLFI